MLKSLSASLIVRGILAVIVGIIALAWSPRVLDSARPALDTMVIVFDDRLQD